MEKDQPYFKGRGAQINPHNPYLANQSVIEDLEVLDEPLLQEKATTFIPEYPKKAINKVDSPDVGMEYSVNPYQGCEHGCVYCYARTTHTYWGMSAGLDFERKIVVKENVAELVEQQINRPNWEVKPIMLSGNTDCYQPAERTKRLTRGILSVMARYRHPVGIITKNSLILRDLDLLKELNKDGLIAVNLSITTLNEALRQRLEPRTVTGRKRLKVVEKLSEAGIPVNVMASPIIPGLNSDELPQLVKAAADHGARNVNYIVVRLNGQIATIFEDWLHTNYPDRAEKVLKLIAECHGGQVQDYRTGVRMRGEGAVAESLRQLFHVAKRQHFTNPSMPQLNRTAFRPKVGKQLTFFS